ncbi:MAG: GNAT family N-acetyltransferase [Fimbriimonadaceae bacterium]|nr:GNAT family N-acetyltransferase [Fimbriimonadaceae bacterium]
MAAERTVLTAAPRRLRRALASDLAHLLRWYGDPVVRGNLGLFAPLTAAEEQHWYADQIADPSNRLFIVEVCHDAQWLPIGTAGTDYLDLPNQRATIGLAIGERDCWNQGHGTAAVRLLLEFLFDDLALQRVELEVFTTNLAAQRVYEKAGLRVASTRREAFYHRGQCHDLHLMRIRREEWAAQRRTA